MVTEPVEAPPEVAAKIAVPEELDDSVTAVPPPGAGDGLPYTSRRSTVNGPRVALAEAVPDTAADVIAKAEPLPAETVNAELVAPVSPADVPASV